MSLFAKLIVWPNWIAVRKSNKRVWIFSVYEYIKIQQYTLYGQTHVYWQWPTCCIWAYPKLLPRSWRHMSRMSLYAVLLQFIYLFDFPSLELNGPNLLRENSAPVHKARSMKTQFAKTGVEELKWPYTEPWAVQLGWSQGSVQDSSTSSKHVFKDLTLSTGAFSFWNKKGSSPNHCHKVRSVKLSTMSLYSSIKITLHWN